LEYMAPEDNHIRKTLRNRFIYHQTETIQSTATERQFRPHFCHLQGMSAE